MIACGILDMIIGIICILYSKMENSNPVYIVFGFISIILGLILLVTYEIQVDQTISDLKKKVKRLEAKKSHDMQ